MKTILQLESFIKFSIKYFKHTTIVLLLCLCNNLLLAQQQPFECLQKIDTSYNVRSEYNKHLKNFPNISIAEIGDTSNLIIHSNLVYASIHNRYLHLDVIKPITKNKKNKFPVIIMIHGGGWRSGNKLMEWPMACELARRGYATVCVEYRLSVEALYPAVIVDVQTAIRWVKENSNLYSFDKKKVVLMGNSSGGQMAALLGTINGFHPKFTGALYNKQSNRVNAVVNIDGILAFIHPESGEGQDKTGKPSAATLWFGTPVSKDPHSRNEASALFHINKKTAPILFINSSIPRFHSGRDDMIKKMKNLKIQTSVYENGKSMHTFWLFNPWFLETVEIIDHFLKNVNISPQL